MRGSVHGPGGKLIVELLQLHLLTILINTKMKIRKDAIKVISIVGGTMAR
jgi:hypothetical protein